MCQLGDCRFGGRHHGDDTHVRTLSRSVSALAAAVCLLAAAVMCVAAFLPYTGWYGDGLLTGGEYPQQVSVSLITGSDVWFVLGTIATLGVAAACHVAGIRSRVSGLIALGASLVALGLALKLPGTWKQDGVTYGSPYLLDAGFYLFLGGAVIAVPGALLMVVTGLFGSEPKAETAFLPLPL